MIDLVSVIGFVGATLILVGFVQVSRGVWRGKDKIFQLVNLIGSALLVWYSVALHAYPVVLLNVVWLSVALWTVLGLIMHRKS